MEINTLGDQYITYNRYLSENSKVHNPSNYLFTLPQYILRKYNSFRFSYELICVNNLIYNEKCRIVARFKDYLVLDDNTEFLRRYYKKKELFSKLTKIFDFYESYCKIFPNYMILPENVFLYKNIRRKQKMLDAINKIKREEEENKKKSQLGELDNDKNNASNLFFTKKIKESINNFNPSVSNILSCTRISEIRPKKSNSNKKDKKKSSKRIRKNNNISNSNEIENELLNLKDEMRKKKKSSLDKTNDDDSRTLNSQSTIKNIIRTLTSTRSKRYEETNSNNKNKNTKKIKQFSQNKHYNQLEINSKKLFITNDKSKSTNDKVKRLISHKPALSVPTVYNLLTENSSGSSIKIFNSVNNIIINDENNKTTSNIKNGMVININNNYFQLKNAKSSLRKKLKNIKSKDKKKCSFNKNEFKLLQKRLYSNDSVSNAKNNTKNISLKPLLTKIFSPHNQAKKKISPLSKESNSYRKKINENKIIKTEWCSKFKLHFKIKAKNKLEGLPDKQGKQRKLTIDRKIIQNFVANNQNKVLSNITKKKNFNKQLYEKIIPSNIKNNNNNNPLNETYTNTFNNLIKNSVIINRFNKNGNKLEKSNNNLIASKKTCLISPIEYRLGKKNITLKNNTNSFQTNNKNKMKSYFSLNKEKTSPLNHINYNKKDKLNNSEENIYINSYNHTTNINKMPTETKGKYQKIKGSKKLKLKEMKKKYHYFIRSNKNNHGSYDISNKFNLFNQFHTINSLSESINNTIIFNNTNTNNYFTTHLLSENLNNKTKCIKKSIYNKKSILSPNNQKNNLTQFLKALIKQQKVSIGRNKVTSQTDKSKLVNKSKETKKVDVIVKCKTKKYQRNKLKH